MIIKKTRHVFSFCVLLSNLLIGGHAKAEFVKYKKYLIPINSCTQYDNDLPRVLYFDDVGILPQDPNGIQELPIIAGLHNYKINLVAIGTNSSYSGSYDLFDKVMSRSRHYNNIPLVDQDKIADRIISEAKCVPAGKFLHVALGGEFYELADALEDDPSIVNKVKAYGIHTSNVKDSRDPGKLVPYNRVKQLLGSNLTMVDFYNSQSNQWKTTTQYFSGKNVRQLFHVFYPRGGFTENKLNGLLFNNINSKLGGITDVNGKSITSTSGPYLKHVSSLAYNHVDAGDKLYLRVADVLTVAHVFMSIRDTYNTAKMHALIKDAASKF